MAEVKRTTVRIGAAVYGDPNVLVIDHNGANSFGDSHDPHALNALGDQLHLAILGPTVCSLVTRLATLLALDARPAVLA